MNVESQLHAKPPRSRCTHCALTPTAHKLHWHTLRWHTQHCLLAANCTHTAPHCNALPCRTASWRGVCSTDTSTHTTIHCNTLQHTATHCNTLQNTARRGVSNTDTMQRTATHHNALQHAATHCPAGLLEDEVCATLPLGVTRARATGRHSVRETKTEKETHERESERKRERERTLPLWVTWGRATGRHSQ